MARRISSVLLLLPILLLCDTLSLGARSPERQSTTGWQSAVTQPTTVPALDPKVTWVLLSWDRTTGTPAEVLTMAARLRTEIGEGPKAKIGLSAFLSLDMTNWAIDTASPAAMNAALAATMAQVDAAIANAKHVKTQTGIDLPIGFSLITAIRERVDGVESGATLEDLRNVQWYHDWQSPASGNGLASGWMTFSQYARKMRTVKEAYVRAFGRLLAQRMALNPEILVAVTGDGEIEMTYERFKDIKPPDDQTEAQRSWADYSPFAVAEFRDWLRGTGMYATGQPLVGKAYPLASRYATDPSPNEKASGVLGNTFNQDFGTTFTTWNLKYFNWNLSDAVTAGAVPGQGIFATSGGNNICNAGYSGSSCQFLNLSSVAGSGTVGGFDAPRPDPTTVMENTEKFWQAFRLFRNQMVQRYNTDFARWVTGGTTHVDPAMPTSGGVPVDRWYSAQVPTDVLFGNPPTDGGVRLLTSGSPHWTANIGEFGGMGVTGYNVNHSPLAGGNGHYDRTVGNVVPLVAALSARWAIVEWNPADPWSSSMDSYRADNEVMRKYRPTLLMPYKINNSSTPEHQWAVFAPAKFVDGLKELMCGQAAVPATASHPAIPARSGISGKAGTDCAGAPQPRGGWLPTITWATPDPIPTGARLSSTQLNATASLPGEFTYNPSAGTMLASTRTLTATFKPTDTDYAEVTASVSQLVLQDGRITATLTSTAGQPIETATMTVYKPGVPTAVGVSTFQLDRYEVYVKAGTYSVQFSAPGFNPKTLTNLVEVASGVSTAITAALEPAGSVSGRVQTTAGAALNGVTVTLSSPTGGPPITQFNPSATTNIEGFFTITGVPSGVYLARTSGAGALGFADELVGKVVVVDGSAAPVPFLFQLPGALSISGTLKGPANEGLQGAQLRAVETGRTDGGVSVTVATQTLGAYVLNGLYPGNWTIEQEFLPDGYVPGASREVSLTNAARTGIDLTAVADVSISGTVTSDVFGPLSGITVQVVNANGEARTATTGAGGTYTVTGLRSGEAYWVRTSNTTGRIDRIYSSSLLGGVECVNCSNSAVAPLRLTSSRTGIDFILRDGFAIEGTVTTTTNSVVSPLAGALVEIFRGDDLLVETLTTNGSGFYRTTKGLKPDEDHFVRTRNGKGYIDEIFPDNGCQTCTPKQGQVLRANAGKTVTASFDLAVGGWVGGTVTSSASASTTIEGVTVDVYIKHPSTGEKVLAGTGVTNAVGVYRTGPLAPGLTYYAHARSILPYSNKVWHSDPALGDCGECNSLSGSPFGMTPDTQSTANFSLTPAFSVQGTVKVGTTPLAGVTVQVFAPKGNAAVLVASDVSSSDGTYSSKPGLPPGQYFVRTSNDLGYVDKVYRITDCLECNVRTGLPVTITTLAHRTGVDFTLAAGGRFSGTVRNSATPATTIGGADVKIYNQDGAVVSTVTAGSNGEYTSIGLPAGPYYARAFSKTGHISEAFSDMDCAACNPLLGKKIDVTAGEITPGTDFSMTEGGTIQGRVTGPSSAKLKDIRVEVVNSTNTVVATEVTDGDGLYFTRSGLPTGTYRVRTSNDLGYIDMAYGSTTCVLCFQEAVGEVTSVTAGGALRDIDIALARGGRIEGTVTRDSNSAALVGVTIEVYRTVDWRVATATTGDSGQYMVGPGLPTGFDYYVRTVNQVDVVDEVHDNKVCAPCVVTNGDPVTVTVGTPKVVNFGLPSSATGTVSGLVLSDEATPVNVAGEAHLVTRLGVFVRSTTMDQAGRYTFEGVHAGTYLLRTAAAVVGTIAYLDEWAGGGRVHVNPPVMTASTLILVRAGQATAVEEIKLTRGAVVEIVAVRVTLAVLSSELSSFRNEFLQDFYTALAVPEDEILTLTASLTASRPGFRSFATTTITPVIGQRTRVVLTGDACIPPTFTTTALSGAQAGAAYSATVAATGGSGALSYAVVVGQLAPGLAINASTGAITGTPSASGASLFTLGATDSTGCLGTRDFGITIAAAPAVNGTASPSTLRFAALKNGTAGALTSLTAAQTVSVSFTGASPDWSVSSNQPWLELSALGGFGSGSFTASIANPSNVIGASTSLSATITISGSGISNAPLTIPVTLTIDQTNGASVTSPIGQVDTPTQNATGVQGAIGVTGWVLDNVGVTGVKIYRNCLGFDNPASCQMVLGHNVVEVGDAAFLAGARTDVEAAFSTFPQSNRAGWGYLMLTSMLPQVTTQQQYGGQGPLTLYVVATDVEGNKKLLGRSSDPASTDFAVPTQITMANATIAKPFGAIDTPGQGQTVGGVLNNFGWALTPDSNTTGGEGADILIPTNGSTMTVFIDSLPVALVAYNQCRGNVGNPVPGTLFCNDDVSNIFGNATPQAVLTNRAANTTLFRNLDAGRAPIGVYSFNTATLSNGLHTIAWSVSDSAGRNEGIGSRFFNVLNSGADGAIGGIVGNDGNDGNATERRARASAPPDVVLDAALRAQPAVARGLASSLAPLPSGDAGVWFRTGFDLMASWNDLPMDEQGWRHIEMTEADRLELWLGAAVDAGYLVANGTLRDLPVGASVKGPQFGWAPPVGYVGTYHLAFIRGGERIDVVVTVKPKQQ